MSKAARGKAESDLSLAASAGGAYFVSAYSPPLPNLSSYGRLKLKVLSWLKDKITLLNSTSRSATVSFLVNHVGSEAAQKFVQRVH